MTKTEKYVILIKTVKFKLRNDYIMINKAFELITGKVEAALSTQGYERVGVANQAGDEMVSLFTSEAVAYSVVYYKKKKHMVLETCAMTDEGPDNDWKTLATWMFDPDTDTMKEAESIANDFDSIVAAPTRIRTVKAAKKKKKDDEGNADPLFFAKRLVNVFPELKEEIRNEEDCYYPFRGATFTRASVVPKVNALLARGNKQEIDKLSSILSAQYDAGDMDTRSIITIIVLNSIDSPEKEAVLFDKLSPALQKAWKAAKRFKGKKVAPEKKKKPKMTMAERLGQ